MADPSRMLVLSVICRECLTDCVQNKVLVARVDSV